MVEPKKDEPKRDSFIHRIKRDERLNSSLNFLRNEWIELLSGCLMFIGIILTFFYEHLGGMLVGLAFGICFYQEIRDYLFYAKGLYSEHGLFKTLMWIGTILYFLIAIPAFIISALIGFGIVFLIRLVSNKSLNK